MADPSRAPVMSGSVAERTSNSKSLKVNGEVVEAPKVNFLSSLTGLFVITNYFYYIERYFCLSYLPFF